MLMGGGGGSHIWDPPMGLYGGDKVNDSGDDVSGTHTHSPLRNRPQHTHTLLS